MNKRLFFAVTSKSPQWAGQSLGFPMHGIAGVLLVAVAWPMSWMHVGLIGEYAFFPLWLGYVLVVDALVYRRTGSSLLTRHPVEFGGMFLASIPLWWIFEGFNSFTQNWQYIGSEHFSRIQYVAVASWHFSIVIPAVFETAALVSTFKFAGRFHRGPKLSFPRLSLVGLVALGILSFVATILWPTYAFPATWLCLVFILDPINYSMGAPSIIGHLRRGDWRIIFTFGSGALICGWFWEMWNYWAYPKWEYSVPLVDFVRVFEMPLLGYGGYIPFGLEVYVVYHFFKFTWVRLHPVISRTNRVTTLAGKTKQTTESSTSG